MVIKHILTGLALAGLASAASASPSAEAGKALAEESCAACHGETGNAPDDPSYPKLSGQKPAYLIQQLRDFRSGARKSEVMDNFAKELTDSQIADLAAWFAAQKRAPEPASMRPIGNAQHGAQLFMMRGMRRPPCAACHAPEDFRRGMGGGGMGRGRMGRGGGMGHGGMGPMMTDPATTPVLYAQHAEYMLAQLDAFAAGTRRGTVMGPIAAGLSEADRRDVAAYLAAMR